MKTAQKTLAAILALLAIAFLAGCDINGDSDTSAGDGDTTVSGDSSTGGSGTGDGDDYTITNDDSITADHDTPSLVNTSWSYSDGTSTYTLEFGSDGNVTWSYVDKGVDYGEISYSDSYKYSVDGSMVTIYYDDDGTFEQLIYSSGQLISGMILTQEGSSGSDSAISLAGTTWTGSDTSFGIGASGNGDGWVVTDVTHVTMTYTFKFKSDGTVATMIDNSEEYSLAYNVDGSTVTIYQPNGDEWVQFTYSSGKLIGVWHIFTKD